MLNPLPLYYKKGNHRLKPEHLTDVFYVGLIIFDHFYCHLKSSYHERKQKQLKAFVFGDGLRFRKYTKTLLFDFIRSVLACDCEPSRTAKPTHSADQ